MYTGKQNSFAAINIGTRFSQECCVQIWKKFYIFSLKSFFIIRTNHLELCSELTISRFATTNQQLYSRNQNYV